MRRAHEEEQGSALIMALVFVTVVSLLIGITLTFAEASVKYGDRVAESRVNLYTADGVMEAAINNAEAGRPCDSPLDLELNGAMPTATCFPMTKGAPSILALGASEGEGIIQAASSEALAIGGGLFSQSKVAGNSARITAEGAVGARGACSGVTATPEEDLNCSNIGTPITPVTPIASADPGYKKAADILPGHQNVPACSGTVPLDPGYYDDAAALTDLTDGSGPCSPSLVYFRPGNYYFDFDYSAATRCSLPANCVWTINDDDVKVVAGTDSQPAVSVQVPGACSGTDHGVQFIFGGKSRMEVLNGKVELCPPATASGPRISVYGMKSGSAPTQVNVPAEAPAEALSTTFSSPMEAIDFNSTPATTTVETGTPMPSITFKSFGFNIPPGSRIVGANLRADHEEGSESSGKLEMTAALSAGGAPFQVLTLDDCAGFRCQDDDNPITVSNLSASKLNSIEVAYSARLISGDGPHYDSIYGLSLTVSYIPAGFEALSGCSVAVFPDAARCALIAVSGQGVLTMGGTLYAPMAAIDASELDGIGAPVFGRGVIARTVLLGVSNTGANRETRLIVGAPPIESGRALTVLGTGAQDGVFVTGEPMVVNGDVMSRSQLSVTHPADGKGLTVRGQVKANGVPCDMNEIEVVTQPASQPTCAADAVGPEVDPAFEPPPLSVSPPTPNPPSCGSTDQLVKIQPGLYDQGDAPSLLALTSATGGCGAKVVWFEPGAYYFNFDSTGSVGCDTPPGALCTWVIDRPDVKVIGGKPNGWNPNAFNASDVYFPGGCETGGTAGVSMVFGGPTRIDLRDGSLELCDGTTLDDVSQTPFTDQPVVAVVHSLAAPAPGGYQPASGCLVLATGSSGACSLITARTTGSKRPKMAIQGIVYAPRTSIEAKLVDVSTPVFGQEVVARAIILDIAPKRCVEPPTSSCYEGPTVVASGTGIPQVNDKTFLFTAFVDGRPRTRARVAFRGSSGAAVIEAWSVLP